MIRELLNASSEQIQSALLDITPWWATIIGWVVTLVAAIIPNIISIFRERSFRKDIEQLKKDAGIHVDRARYFEKKPEFLGKLEKIKKELSMDVWGEATAHEIDLTLTDLSLYSKQLKFCTEDIVKINRLLAKVRSESDIEKERVSIGEIEEMILVLNKGENSI